LVLSLESLIDSGDFMLISMTTRAGFEWYYITMLLILPQYREKEKLFRFAHNWNVGVLEYWIIGAW
jgi:hypothetical protein